MTTEMGNETTIGEEKVDGVVDADDDGMKPYHFVEREQLNPKFNVPSITDAFVENYPSVVDRFFVRYYYMMERAGERAVPYQVLFHSNRICLICLPPEHPACVDGVSSLTFDIGNTDRSKNQVKGKGKKGGMILQADSTLALVTSATGNTYKVPSCIRGKLVEVNVDLAQTPTRLQTASEGEAYLAIVLPKPEQCDEIKASLLTEAQYKEWLTNK